MSQIRGLELLFNLQKNNLKSKEDCVVAVFHCLLINEGYLCTGIGDEWPESDFKTTELLPVDWNSNQNVYSLRYMGKDSSHILLKVTKMEHLLQVDVVLNEDAVASMSVPVENYIDNYSEYSTAYKDLNSLSKSFHEDIMQKIKPKAETKPSASSSGQSTKTPSKSENPAAPIKRPSETYQEREPCFPQRFPRVGGRDLDPFREGGGGMFMDPFGMGVPSRPSLPDFGVGIPGGLPRGAVPPGARFDPFMPPMPPSFPRRFPDPDFDFI